MGGNCGRMLLSRPLTAYRVTRLIAGASITGAADPHVYLIGYFQLRQFDCH